MPRKPNYRFDRLQRERAKAAKKAEKAKAKAEAKAKAKEGGAPARTGDEDSPALDGA